MDKGKCLGKFGAERAGGGRASVDSGEVSGDQMVKELAGRARRWPSFHGVSRGRVGVGSGFIKISSGSLVGSKIGRAHV